MKNVEKFVPIVIMLLLALGVKAHDFKVDGVYYNILSSETCEVTFDGFQSSTVDNEYSGYVQIPDVVLFGGNVYNVTRIGHKAFEYCSELKYVIVGGNVETIESDAFQYCSGLESISFKGEVKLIESSAFAFCEKLSQFEIPKNLSRIHNHTFQGCKSLTEISIPPSVSRIAHFAFDSCSNLTKLVIEDAVDAIEVGSDAFYGCPIETMHRGRDIDRKLLNPLERSFTCDTTLVNLTIGEKVTAIEDNAFLGCNKLSAVVLPSGLKNIGEYAFAYCTGLEMIEIPAEVVAIGLYAFQGCTNLNRVSLSRNLAALNSGTFKNCSSLPDIVIPNSVKMIGANVFDGCIALEDVYIGAGVVSIGNNCFNGCANIKSVRFGDNPTSMTSMGLCSMSGAKGLFYASKIEDVYWGRNLSKEITSPFQGQADIKEITIGHSVTQIHYSLFGGTGSVEVINSLNPEPPYIHSVVLSDAYDNAVVYIPIGSMAAYKRTASWMHFKNIQEKDFAESDLDIYYNVSVAFDDSLGSVFTCGEKIRAIALNANEVVDFEFIPEPGYEIASVTLGGEDITESIIDGKYVVGNLVSNIELVADFTPVINCYPVNVDYDIACGKILLNGVETSQYEIEEHKPLEIEVQPSVGYILDSLFVNGENVTNNVVSGRYVIENVVSELNLRVVFALDQSGLVSLAERGLRVGVNGNTLFVSGVPDDAEVKVYDAIGMMVYAGNKKEILLEKRGVYIISVADKFYKILL